MKPHLNKPTSLTSKAEAALHAAAERTISQARMNKKTLVVWRNGRVVRLSANRVRKRTARMKNETANLP